MENNNLFFNLPSEIQDNIIEMKNQIEEREKADKFGEYIKQREEHNKKMQLMNAKYKDVRIPFGKYKGNTIYDIAVLKDRYYMPVGKKYLKWVLENVEIKNALLKECIEFYKTYHYNHRDGYD